MLSGVALEVPRLGQENRAWHQLLGIGRRQRKKITGRLRSTSTRRDRSTRRGSGAGTRPRARAEGVHHPPTRDAGAESTVRRRLRWLRPSGGRWSTGPTLVGASEDPRRYLGDRPGPPQTAGPRGEAVDRAGEAGRSIPAGESKSKVTAPRGESHRHGVGSDHRHSRRSHERASSVKLTAAQRSRGGTGRSLPRRLARPRAPVLAAPGASGSASSRVGGRPTGRRDRCRRGHGTRCALISTRCGSRCASGAARATEAWARRRSPPLVHARDGPDGVGAHHLAGARAARNPPVAGGSLPGPRSARRGDR